MTNNETSPATVEDGAGPPEEEDVQWHEVNARLRYEWLEAVMDSNIARDTGDTESHEAAERRIGELQNEFMSSNRALAMSAAKPFLSRAMGEDQRDYEQAALLGMWEAFVGTDPVAARQVRFSDDGRLVAASGWDPVKATFGTFSRRAITGKVMRAVAGNESGVSYAYWTDKPAVTAARDRLIEAGNPTPTTRQVAAEAGMPFAKVEAILAPRAVSLQSPLGDGDGTLADIVLGEDAPVQYSEDLSALFNECVREAASKLKTTDLFCYLLRTGVAGRAPLSAVDTASRLGLGRGGVGSAERRASAAVRAAVSGRAGEYGRQLAEMGLRHAAQGH